MLPTRSAGVSEDDQVLQARSRRERGGDVLRSRIEIEVNLTTTIIRHHFTVQVQNVTMRCETAIQQMLYPCHTKANCKYDGSNLEHNSSFS